MNVLKAVGLVACVVAGAVLAPAIPAAAQEPPGVTLKSSRKQLTFPEKTILSGTISPEDEGETISILDQEGRVVAQAQTNAQGRYSVAYAPRKNVTLTAQWLAALSQPVTVNVRPRVTAKLKSLRLFDKARLHGAVAPRHEGETVVVRLYRFGRLAARREIQLKNGIFFSTRVRVRKPGSYRVEARIYDGDHLPGRGRSAELETYLPSLGIGSSGRYVQLFEGELFRRGYHVGGRDDYFDYRTSDAVIAFNKVQGRSRVGSVDESTWRALADPIVPQPRLRNKRFHIEIDQTKQVLYLVKKKKVRRIVHTSTGAGGATHDGSYRVFRKIAGYSGGGLYYPSYFDGLRAIHGWPEVPTYPASHGCARVPMWTAKFLHRKAVIGTRVLVYH